MSKTAQQRAYTVMDYALRAQEANTELLRKITEVWIEGLRKQTDLSGHMAQEFSEKAEDQVHAYQGFFGQWVMPFMSFPFVRMPYGPFGMWNEWTQAVTKNAQNTQRTVARETARAIETTAPIKGTLPIAGYDQKSVGEI